MRGQSDDTGCLTARRIGGRRRAHRRLRAFQGARTDRNGYRWRTLETRSSGKPRRHAKHRRLDSRRCLRCRYDSHRKGRTWPGSQDGAAPGRGRGAQGSSGSAVAGHSRHCTSSQRRLHGCKPLDAGLRYGKVFGPNRMRLGYGELVRDQLLSVEAKPTSRLTAPADCTVLNQPVPRIDIPAKVTGRSAYVQDLRPEGMLHGRVVRPPSYGATLRGCDIAQVERTSGIVKVVRDGNLLGVLADREWTAVQGMRTLAATTIWIEQQALPDSADLPAALMKLPSHDTTIHDTGSPGKPGILVEGTFSRPYLTHGSIGPSCAIAQF